MLWLARAFDIAGRSPVLMRNGRQWWWRSHRRRCFPGHWSWGAGFRGAGFGLFARFGVIGGLGGAREGAVRGVFVTGLHGPEGGDVCALGQGEDQGFGHDHGVSGPPAVGPPRQRRENARPVLARGAGQASLNDRKAKPRPPKPRPRVAFPGAPRARATACDTRRHEAAFAIFVVTDGKARARIGIDLTIVPVTGGGRGD